MRTGKVKPIKPDQAEPEDICQGGFSFDCRKITGKDMPFGHHMRGRWFGCFHCGTYLGCTACAQREDELICLNCDSHLKPPGNWGTQKAWSKHGRIIRDLDIKKEAFNILRMRSEGRITEDDSNCFYTELFSKKGNL